MSKLDYLYAAPHRRYVFAIRLVCLCLSLMAAGCVFKSKPLPTQNAADRGHTQTVPTPPKKVVKSVHMGLFEAMVRGVYFHLPHRIKRMEDGLSVGDLDLSHPDSLSRLVASVGYSVHPEALETVPPAPNQLVTMGENKQKVTHLALVWSAMDFGMIYVQTKQQADGGFLSREQRRKSFQNVIQDVRDAYWRAATASILLPVVDQLIDDARLAQEKPRHAKPDGQTPSAATTEDQQVFQEVIRQLWTWRKKLTQANHEFFALLNLPADGYTVRASTEEIMDGKFLELPVAKLENFALRHRPELLESDAQEYISAQQVRKALSVSLPGFGLASGRKQGARVPVLNQPWSQAGLQLTRNLFRWGLNPRAGVAVDKQKKSRKLAFGMVVLTQLQLSMQNYNLAQKNFHIIQDLNMAQENRAKLPQSAKPAKTGVDIEVIRQRADSLVVRVRQGLAFAEVQSALGRIQTTLGLDIVPAEFMTNPAYMTALAKWLASHQTSIAAAILSDVPKSPSYAKRPVTDSTVAEADSELAKKDQSKHFNTFLEQVSNPAISNAEHLPSPSTVAMKDRASASLWARPKAARPAQKPSRPVLALEPAHVERSPKPLPIEGEIVLLSAD